MWTCKKCGQAGINDEWHECWNCGTGSDWIPPSDWVPPSDAERQQQARLPPKTAAPLSSDRAGALSALGFVVGLLGVITGDAMLFNCPEAPSAYSTDALTDIARAIA